ncbi:MAG TPA: phage Gp37/Gp68 family protein [Blastocatellia bacterium]|nr:phage Gp37/Gp68 family protein [Blastocatellia bacterium]
MGANSKIEWTDHTFNLAWGCTRVSEACKYCYAETWAKRTGFSDLWGAQANRRTFGENHWREPLKWNEQAGREGVRRRVFCSSMADVFEDHPTIAQERLKLWPLIQATPHLDWLLLTKRPENLSRMLPFGWFGEGADNHWPNVWLGTTCENQQRADERIPELLRIPAHVRFLSCEPLLGPIDLLKVFPALGVSNEKYWDEEGNPIADGSGFADIHWVIAGGESGPHARPSHPDWLRSLRDQCAEAGVPFFFKQWGEHLPHGQSGADGGRVVFDSHQDRWTERIGKKNAGNLLDGREWKQFPN